MISENNEKIKHKLKKTNNNKSNKTKLKENLYSMSDGNTCIAEPNLEVLLPFTQFNTKIV